MAGIRCYKEVHCNSFLKLYYSLISASGKRRLHNEKPDKEIWHADVHKEKIMKSDRQNVRHKN